MSNVMSQGDFSKLNLKNRKTQSRLLGSRPASYHQSLVETKTDDEVELPPSTYLLAYSHRLKSRKKARKMQKSHQMRKSYKMQKSQSIFKKQHVGVEVEQDESKYRDLNEVTAITDIDPNYFKELSSRVSRERFSIRQYIDDIRQVLSTRLLIGQQRDDCIRIDQQFEQEQKKMDQIKKKYLFYVKCFEEFLAEEHNESMRVLNEANEEVGKTAVISAKRNQLSKEYGHVRLEVYLWEEAWRMVKQCQKFLYQVSPLSWREQHDWINQPEETRSCSNMDSKKSGDLFGSPKTDDATSLISLIDLFEREVENAPPSELYFDDPLDLIRVFKTIELQNLNALIHLESLAGPLADMAMTISVTEERIKSEMNEIFEGIKDLEESIRGAEERATGLEQYANYLLHGVFRDLVCSEQVLYLRVFIEDTYESCVGPNDANLDSFLMMRSIEKTYEDLNKELDSLPHEVVSICEKTGFRDELRVMKEAEDAARKFELMHRLLAALKRIIEPPKPKKRQLMCRSTPKQPKPKPVVQLPPLTEQEQYYLHFFTNYTPQDDYNTFRDQFPADFNQFFKTNRTERASSVQESKEEEVCPFFS